MLTNFFATIVNGYMLINFAKESIIDTWRGLECVSEGSRIKSYSWSRSDSEKWEFSRCKIAQVLRNQNKVMKIFSASVFRYFEVIVSYWTVFNKRDIPGLYLMDLSWFDFIQRFLFKHFLSSIGPCLINTAYQDHIWWTRFHVSFSRLVLRVH